MRNFVCGIYLLIVFSVTACTFNFEIEDNFAPVSDISLIEPIPKKGKHYVLPGETLYSIAWRYGLDYEELVKLNRLRPPYQIHAGEYIYLNKNKPIPPIVKARTPIVTQPIEPPAKIKVTENIEPTRTVNIWTWPARGPIIGKFSSLNKGINIKGQTGDPIFATAAGKVVYSGNGLRGYGNLIIIKHNSTFLTAYAHNDKILVKNGAWVKSGQQIAEMGNTGTKQTMLHFEIRRHGQPVNPLIYLDKKI